MRLVYLRGAPGCGKNTIAEHLEISLVNQVVVVLNVSDFVGMLVQPYLGIDQDTYDFLCENLTEGVAHEADLKNTPIGTLLKEHQLGSFAENIDAIPEKFHDKSIREHIIHVSEQIMKPTFGQKVFGNILLQTIKMLYAAGVDVVILTSCGFPEEVIPVADWVAETNAFEKSPKIEMFLVTLYSTWAPLVQLNKNFMYKAGDVWKMDSRKNWNPADYPELKQMKLTTIENIRDRQSYATDAVINFIGEKDEDEDIEIIQDIEDNYIVKDNGVRKFSAKASELNEFYIRRQLIQHYQNMNLKSGVNLTNTPWYDLAYGEGEGEDAESVYMIRGENALKSESHYKNLSIHILCPGVVVENSQLPYHRSMTSLRPKIHPAFDLVRMVNELVCKGYEFDVTLMVPEDTDTKNTELFYGLHESIKVKPVPLVDEFNNRGFYDIASVPDLEIPDVMIRNIDVVEGATRNKKFGHFEIRVGFEDFVTDENVAGKYTGPKFVYPKHLTVELGNTAERNFLLSSHHNEIDSMDGSPDICVTRLKMTDESFVFGVLDVMNSHFDPSKLIYSATRSLDFTYAKYIAPEFVNARKAVMSLIEEKDTEEARPVLAFIRSVIVSTILIDALNRYLDHLD